MIDCAISYGAFSLKQPIKSAMKQIKQKHTLFILLALIISGLIAYFGYRTIAHEALLRHYQNATLAQSHVNQIEARIQSLLNEEAAHLEGIAGYLSLTPKSIQTLIGQEANIQAVFVLEQNKLIYPNLSPNASEEEANWARQIQPLVYDPSLLYSHAILSEFKTPESGWYISQDNNDTLLIYWLKKDKGWIGFKVFYSYFLANVINAMDDINLTASIVIKESDRTLVEKGDAREISSQNLILSHQLPYPLNAWQINYYLKSESNTILYAIGMGAILSIILFFCGFLLYVYREYQRTLKQAAQQVNFVGQVSHELKTPLTNILLYTELLKESLGDESEAAYSLDVISSESRRLSRLIQNVLSFTRAPEIHAKKLEVNELIQHIHQLFSPVFSAKGMQLNLISSAPCYIYSDVDRVTQIISNFLSNAEKYASDGKTVDLKVTVNSKTSEVYISVRDYGKGVPSSLLATIFKPFYRLNTSITEGVSGTGIGLTIAEQLAKSLNAKIVATNEDKGMRFTLCLPLYNKEDHL